MDYDSHHILLCQPLPAVEGGVCEARTDTHSCGVRAGGRTCLLLEGQAEEQEEWGERWDRVEVLETMEVWVVYRRMNIILLFGPYVGLFVSSCIIMHV